MEPRKNPEKDIRKYSGLFFNIGLVITLVLCISAFEWKFEEHSPKISGTDFKPFDEILPPIPPTVHPPKPKPIIPDIIEAVPDEVLEDLPEPILDPDLMKDFEPEIAEPEPEVIKEPDFILIAEEMPTPQGGYAAFYNFLARNIKYPTLAIRNGEEGKVFLSFIVEKNGTISSIEIVRGLGYGCNEEAIRVLKKFPGWNPGKQRYRPVRVKLVLPVTFKLN